MLLTICFAFSVVLCGCSNEQQALMVDYSGDSYVSVSNWYPIDEKYESITVKLEGKDYNACLYSLSGQNVIKVEGDLAGEIYFVSENVQLPDYKQADIVEKIVIDEFSGKETTAKDKNEILEWIDIISTAPPRSSKDEVIGSINIYYKDFPAFQYYGNLCKNKSGQYTIAVN